MEYIVTPYLSVPKTLKDLQTYCDYYNEVGKRCQAAGLKYGYHNHAHEFQKVEDKELMLDYMLQHTNPEYAFFQMDVYWARTARWITSTSIPDASPCSISRITARLGRVVW